MQKDLGAAKDCTADLSEPPLVDSTPWQAYRLEEHPELLPTLFEMVRLPPDFPSHWAHGPEATAEPALRPVVEP